MATNKRIASSPYLYSLPALRYVMSSF